MSIADYRPFNLVRRMLRALGADLVRYSPSNRTVLKLTIPDDIDVHDREIIGKVRECTMTTVEGQATLINAVRYIVRNRIPGAVVECGVWRGGCSMAMALALLQEGIADRDVYLYDTFRGMTAPGDVDKTDDGVKAQVQLDLDTERSGIWCVAGVADVRCNMLSTGYPEEKVHLVEGDVERTIPESCPDGPIALLRLDTDWYASTRHELEHLFPRLSPGGILIIDDYGYWQGARQAVDEYLATLNFPVFLHRVDRSQRLFVKPWSEPK